MFNIIGDGVFDLNEVYFIGLRYHEEKKNICYFHLFVRLKNSADYFYLYRGLTYEESIKKLNDILKIINDNMST